MGLGLNSWNSFGRLCAVGAILSLVPGPGDSGQRNNASWSEFELWVGDSHIKSALLGQ